jgi:hypothetical protein
MGITDARKNANKKWDAENYCTVSCRMSKAERDALREKLTSRGLTVHTFVRNACEMYLIGNHDELLEPQLTREQRSKELDDIVRGKSLHG